MTLLYRLQHLLDHHEFEKADQLAKFHSLDREVSLSFALLAVIIDLAINNLYVCLQVIQKHRALHLLAEISQCDLLDSAVIDSFVDSIGQSLSLVKVIVS